MNAQRDVQGPAKEQQAPEAQHEENPAEHDVAPDAYAGATAHFRAREAAWQAEAAPIAAELGVTPEIHSNAESKQITEDHGSNAVALGNVIHLHPDKIAPGTTEGHGILVHEITHIAQAKKTSPGPREAAEAEAANAAASGDVKPPEHGIDLSKPAGDGDADKKKPAIDLKGAPYQWVSGTFNMYVSTAWYKSASDFKEVDGGALAPSRIRELLTVLHDKGMLTWADASRIATASQDVGVPVGDKEVMNVSLGTTAFAALGLPPGTNVLVGLGGEGPGGMDIVVKVPGADGADGKEFDLSAALKQQIITAVEGFTKMKAKPDIVAAYLAAPATKVTVNAGAAWIKWSKSSPEALFGKDEYEKWTKAPKDASDFQFDIGQGNQATGDLQPDELEFIKKWLKDHAGGSGGRPIAVTRALLEELHAIDALPEAWRDHVYALMHPTADAKNPNAGKADDGMLTSDVLKRMVQTAKVEWEREAAGFTPLDHKGGGAPPTFDWPLPARIDQKNGLIIDGENVEFDVLIDWPPAYTANAQSDYTWRPMRASVDWMFEAPDADAEKKTGMERATSYIDWSQNGKQNHKFHLPKGKDSAIWTVHAFVRHNFFQPAHLTTQVEVKTEAKRLEEQRQEAFQSMGQPNIVDKDKEFETQSDYDYLFDKHKYDHGILFRGDLPEDYKTKTPEERKKSIQAEIDTNTKMLEYLRTEGTHPDAVTACEHYLAKLQDALKAMDEDAGDKNMTLFDIKGFFLGRDNHVADGPLDLYGSFKKEWGGITVQIRDLSRRLDADNYTFTGHADTFEKALELAYVDLCKKYPGGKVSILAEGYDAKGDKPTGKSVGFELDTGSAWKDTKEVVFDPVVNVAVNIAGAIAAIFVPEIAIPLLILYNETQNLDSMQDEMRSGTLTWGKGAMHLAQLGLDIMPAIGAAPVFKSSKAAFLMFQVASLGGQALLMEQQVSEQIREIRDGQVKDMAGVFAQYVDLEKNTQASDPKRAEMKAKIDKQAEAIRQTSIDVWTSAIAQFAIVAIPSHAAGMLGEHYRAGKISDLTASGKFVENPSVEKPFYNEKTGQIEGAQKNMDIPTINKLTAEQAEHMQKMGGRLATEIGVEPEKVNLQAGDENKIWKDGDKVEVRYKPGTDPELALKAWEADAKKNHITKPGAHPAPEPKPPAVHDNVPVQHPTKPSDHEVISETAKIDPELAGGTSQAKESTASKVPGSDFKGGVKAGDKANIDAIVAEAKGSFTDAVKAAIPDATVVKAGDDTYVVTLKDGSQISVRIMTGPVAGEAVARTVINNTKEGVIKGAGPSPKPGDPPGDVAVKGRYVIQLSETMEPSNTKRALAHEVAEIGAERQLSAQEKGVGPDLLGANTKPEPGAVLSPHDQGRVAEIKVLAEKVNAGDAGAKREMLALIEELGLRDGEPGSAERRKLVNEALKDDPKAAAALDTMAKPAAELPPDVKAQLAAVQTAREGDLAKAKAAEETKANNLGHDMPDARPPEAGRIFTTDEAAALAREAEQHRARVAAETLAEYRAQAASMPEGTYPKVKDVQMGGGAALTARDSEALLIDPRGRWQADASDKIAQTANQLRGIKEAGLGDPFQFAKPDDRVPMSAIKYWEDNIAAQGKTIDGKVTKLEIENGKTIITVQPTDGSKAIKLEVEGSMLMAMGFPTERLPGTPREVPGAGTIASPEMAVDKVKSVLQTLKDDPDPKAAKRAKSAADALAEIKDVTGLENDPGQRGKDLTKLQHVLEKHGLADVLGAKDGDLSRMVKAGVEWEKLTKDHPKQVLLGDTANLATLDVKAAPDGKWVINGVSGTGISAAEIIFGKAAKEGVDNIHVTMVGDKPPRGLADNDQFLDVMRKHADEASVAQFKKGTGIDLDISKSDKKLTLIFGVSLDNPPTSEHGQFSAADKALLPADFTGDKNAMQGTGYVAAVGRPFGLPPMASVLLDSLQASGGRMTMEPKYVEGRYVGYRLFAIDKAGTVLKEMDVTGAQSRFPPWDMLEAGNGNHNPHPDPDAAWKVFDKAQKFDSPDESGNFNAGFTASAEQGADYAAAKKAGKL